MGSLSYYTFENIVLLAHGPAGPQAFINLAWVLLDFFIVVIYIKYGRERFPKDAKQFFIPFSILAFVSCFAIQFAFLFEFGAIAGAQYSAFAQNVAMSIMFLAMVFLRQDTRGQSMYVAVAKWLGTLVPTILKGVVESFNIYIIVMGVVCSIFDLLYIGCLSAKIKKEKEGLPNPISAKL